MPTPTIIADKTASTVITTGMKNTPSTDALMTYTRNYKKVEESQIPQDSPEDIDGIDLSPASSFSVDSSSIKLAAVRRSSSSSAGSDDDSTKPSSSRISRHQWCTVAILTFVNLINYMDRYTIAGKSRELFLLLFVVDVVCSCFVVDAIKKFNV